jgi:hypothetical protein
MLCYKMKVCLFRVRFIPMFIASPSLFKIRDNYIILSSIIW